MEEFKPVCSVCIANYNGESFLSDCLDSVYSQKFEQSVEILVYDDASTDASVELIKEKYPNVILIESQNNVGFCISNNRMVDKAKGRLILLLNNDAALRQGALQTLYDAILEHGDGVYGLPQYNSQTGELIDRGSFFDLFLNPIPNLDSTITNVGMVTGACFFISKSLWSAIGGFPEHFESLAEDAYLCCAARLIGRPVKIVNKSGFEHWVGRSLGGGKVEKNNKLNTTVNRRKLSERNKFFAILMTYPAVLLFVTAPLHIVLLISEGVILSILNKNFYIWRDVYYFCLVQCIKQRKNISNKRKEIQNMKSVTSLSFLAPMRLLPHKLYLLLKYGLPKINN